MVIPGKGYRVMCADGKIGTVQNVREGTVADITLDGGKEVMESVTKLTILPNLGTGDAVEHKFNKKLGRGTVMGAANGLIVMVGFKDQKSLMDIRNLRLLSKA